MLQNVTTPYNATNLGKFMSKKSDDDETELDEIIDIQKKILKQPENGDPKESDDEDIPTTELMYFLTRSMKRDSRYLGTAVIAFLIIVGFTILFTLTFYTEASQFGTFIDHGDDCKQLSMNQYVYEICYTFEPYAGTIPEDVVSLMYQWEDSANTTIIVFIVILGVPLIYTYVKLRRTRNEMQDVADEYIRDSYFLNMELASPTGRNKAEKIFNLLKSVFPEVRLLSEHEPDMKFEGTNVSGYEFALNLDTKGGKIGVMFFSKLTYEELKKFAKKVNGTFDKENDRIICIAKEFGDEFIDLKAENEEDYSDELEERMNQLPLEGHVDLIKEEKSGYSIMWID